MSDVEYDKQIQHLVSVMNEAASLIQVIVTKDTAAISKEDLYILLRLKRIYNYTEVVKDSLQAKEEK